MRNNNIGSVSSGTMRPEDLIPTFIDELKRQNPLASASKTGAGDQCTDERGRLFHLRRL